MGSTRNTGRPVHFTGGGVFQRGASRITCDPGFAICPHGCHPKQGAGSRSWAQVTCKHCLKYAGKEERDV